MTQSSRQSCIFLLVLAILLNLWLTAQAALAPAEVAVLANSSFDGSVELAEYYCRARNILFAHIIALPMPDGELVARTLYEKSIALQVRQELEKIPHSENIRCLVTVRGVPLRIGPSRPTNQERSLLSKLRQKSKQALEDVDALLQQARRLAGLQLSLPTAPTKKPPQSSAAQLAKRTLTEVDRVRQKINSLPESLYRQALTKEFEQIEQDLFGLPAQINRLGRQRPFKLADPRTAKLAALNKRLRETLQKIRQLMRPGATPAQLEEAAKLARQSRGALGLAQQLDASERLIKYPYEQSSSSFDSELSLLFAGQYPKRIFRANQLSLDYRVRTDKQVRTLMVSRIDGPTDRLARGLIDMAIRAQARGLSGRAYVDAGWNRAAKKGYKPTEQSLLDTAKILTEFSRLPVTLDTRNELFADGACPQAALYCGWYSLKKYVDAFDWVEGAVGYHIASFELTSLRDPKFTGWATSMLRDGITATLGAVDEPLLVSFPPPQRFFTLLLTGRFSLVECYYMTKRFNSWQLVLIGDPLYTPFAGDPRLTIPQAEKILKHKLAHAP